MNSASTKNAIFLLVSDHLKVKQLFQQFEDIKDDQNQAERKADLVGQICMELSVHAFVEEEIFYPAVRAAIDDDDLMDEAEAEHASVKDLVSQIETMHADEQKLNTMMTVLAEQVEHHVREEEDEMFVKIRKTDINLDSLGELINERKDSVGPYFKSPLEAKSDNKSRPADL